jgi:hypothetical protein
MTIIDSFTIYKIVIFQQFFKTLSARKSASFKYYSLKHVGDDESK